MGRVLDDDGDRLRFRHDLIRDALYEDLPLNVRQGLHREAGQRLAGSGAPILQVAEQFARGARSGDAEAVGWLTRAARQAAPTSPDVAADLLERAIALMNPADPGRGRMLAEQAESLMLAGSSPRPRRPAASCWTAAMTLARKGPHGSASATLSCRPGGRVTRCRN